MKAPTLPYFDDASERPDGLELFFDLVFVLCVGQLARVLRDDPTWSSALLVVLVFVPVWWSWTGITFALDRFPGDDALTRVLVLVAAFAAGLMAVSVPGLPATGSVRFAVGYATVRFVLVVLNLRSAPRSPDAGRQPRLYAVGFGVVGVLWLLSAVVPLHLRVVMWVVATLVDVAIPMVVDRALGLLPVDRTHLPQRFGSFVIIVLGESLISTTTVALDRGLDPTTGLLLTEDFVVAAALWWGFFDRGAWRRRYRALESDESGRLANIVCAYLHFPLVVGVTFVAGGAQAGLAHAGAAEDVGAAAAFIYAGTVLYLLTLNVMTWVLRIPRDGSLTRPRLVLVAALTAWFVVTRDRPAALFFAGCAVVLVVHVLLNLRRDRADDDRRSRPRGPAAECT